MRLVQSLPEYLFASSQNSLEALEVARLTCSSNLRKEICQVLDEWITAEVDARLSPWILDYRRAQQTDSHASSPERDQRIRSEYLTMRFLLSQDELPQPAVLSSGSMTSTQQLSFPGILRSGGARSLLHDRSVSLVSYGRSGSLKLVVALNGSSQCTGLFSSKAGPTLKLAGAALQSLEYFGEYARTLGRRSGSASRARDNGSRRGLPTLFPLPPRSMYCYRSTDTPAHRIRGRACSDVLHEIRPPQRGCIPFRRLALNQFSMAAAS